MTRLNLGSGVYVIPGFDNLDLTTGWRFEDGLGQYPDGSVEAVTIAHALMYVALPDWPAIFKEMARVIEPGGILRVTEDSTADPASERYGGHPEAVTLTSPNMLIEHMAAAGLTARVVTPDETMFRDESLIQRLHGPPPKVTHVEGVKP